MKFTSKRRNQCVDFLAKTGNVSAASAPQPCRAAMPTTGAPGKASAFSIVMPGAGHFRSVDPVEEPGRFGALRPPRTLWLLAGAL